MSIQRTVRNACVLALGVYSLGFTAEAAHACSYNSPVRVGRQTVEERRAEKRDERDAARRARWEFRSDVRAGRIDSAAGLAELFIPNVREWYADRSNCGPGGDGHGPSMSNTEMVAAAFAGSELDGIPGEALRSFVSGSFERGIRDHNLACNEEFRARFADQLRREMSQRDRDTLFLRMKKGGNRQSVYYHFSDARRLERPQLVSWERTNKLFNDTDIPINRTLDAFWTDAAPQLRNPALICPAAYRQLLMAREEEVQRLRRRWSTRPEYLESLKRKAVQGLR